MIGRRGDTACRAAHRARAPTVARLPVVATCRKHGRTVAIVVAVGGVIHGIIR